MKKSNNWTDFLFVGHFYFNYSFNFDLKFMIQIMLLSHAIPRFIQISY